MAVKLATKPEIEAEDEFDLDPRAVREKAALERPEMAALMGMSDFGYNAWEAGTRRPGGPAYRLLRLIERHPKTVIPALRA